MKRVSVYIDAGNFYHLVLKRIGISEVQFDFDRFVEFLSEGGKITDEGKRFYVGTVRQGKNNHESNHAMRNQTRLFTELSKTEPPWNIKTSKLRTRIEKLNIDDRVESFQKLLDLGITEIKFSRSREKGIDVKIATDLIVGAVDDKYDIAVIVSSDTDLVPAIDWVRKRKQKTIQYVGFSFPEISKIIDGEKVILSESIKPTDNMIKNSDIQRILVETDVKKFIKEDLFSIS